MLLDRDGCGGHLGLRRFAVRRNRIAAAVAGGALLAVSALTRFGIFDAGVESARDPRYTVQPQRERRAQAER